ncbi:ComF family protein [Salininema proteolyticum]|uniref:ComF family protein n=1 Tax=Salininema proteolyticum TaxID=1607685 RepID=A0ABV8U606_9ACTN
MRLSDRILNLAVPARCAGCRLQRDTVQGLCLACRESLVPSAHAFRRRGLPAVTAVGRYTDVLAEVLNEYKERGRRELARPLSGLLRPTLTAWQLTLPSRPILVPVPATPSARRARGFDHVSELGRHLDAVLLRLLGARDRPDSVGLGESDRERFARKSLYPAVNPATAFAAIDPETPAPDADTVAEGPSPGASSVPADRPVLLLDDIVTTGATLRAATAVLRSVGVRVAGALVLARAR